MHNVSFSGLLNVMLIFLFILLLGHSRLVLLMTHLDGWICCLRAVLQDTFPYSGLCLALPCIYSTCKNCRAVNIYNNTACSHCMCVLYITISMWLAVDLCVDLVCTLFSELSSSQLVMAFAMVACYVCVCLFVCRVRVCARLRSDLYDWAASLFFLFKRPFKFVFCQAVCAA